MSERYVNLEDEIYYCIIDRDLLNRRISKNIYWYSEADVITAQYIKTYEQLSETQQNIEATEEKIRRKKDKIKHLIDALSSFGKFISIIFIKPQIKQATKKLNEEFAKALKLKHELNQLIHTEYIQKELKKYREEHPWPKGCI